MKDYKIINNSENSRIINKILRKTICDFDIIKRTIFDERMQNGYVRNNAN